jgi:hypothetical protein
MLFLDQLVPACYNISDFGNLGFYLPVQSVITSCCIGEDGKTWAAGTNGGLVVIKSIGGLMSPQLLNCLKGQARSLLPLKSIVDLKFDKDKHLFSLYDDELMMLTLKNYLLTIDMGVRKIIGNEKGLKRMELLEYEDQLLMALAKEQNVYFIALRPSIALLGGFNLQTLMNSDMEEFSDPIGSGANLEMNAPISIVDVSWTINKAESGKVCCFVFEKHNILVFRGSIRSTAKTRKASEVNNADDTHTPMKYKDDPHQKWHLYRELKGIAKEDNLRAQKCNIDSILHQGDPYDKAREEYLDSDFSTGWDPDQERSSAWSRTQGRNTFGNDESLHDTLTPCRTPRSISSQGGLSFTGNIKSNPNILKIINS